MVCVLALLAVACGEGSTDPAASITSPTGSSAPGGRMERPDPTSSPHEEEEEHEIDEGYYVELEIEDSRFIPAAIEMSVGQELEPFNADPVLHNVSIEELGMSFDVEPGVKELYSPPVNLPPGTYTFFCRFHRAAGMRGTLTMNGDRDVITLKRGY